MADLFSILLLLAYTIKELSALRQRPNECWRLNRACTTSCNYLSTQWCMIVSCCFVTAVPSVHIQPCIINVVSTLTYTHPDWFVYTFIMAWDKTPIPPIAWSGTHHVNEGYIITDTLKWYFKQTILVNHIIYLTARNSLPKGSQSNVWQFPISSGSPSQGAVRSPKDSMSHVRFLYLTPPPHVTVHRVHSTHGFHRPDTKGQFG